MEKEQRFFIHDKVTSYILLGLTLADTKRIFLEKFQKEEISFDVFEWNEHMDSLSLDPAHAITAKFSIYDKSYVVFEGH